MIVAGKNGAHSPMQEEPSDAEAFDATLRFIAQRGWQGQDSEFFNALVKHLAGVLDVAYVLVDRVISEREDVVETVALYSRGKLVTNIDYDLAGTPCENVVGREFCCYAEKIQDMFPDDRLLSELQAESYAGIPLWSSSGEPLGLIAVMDDKPLRNPGLVERLLQVVALRASAELERRQILAELETSRQRFEDFATATSDWFWEMDENLQYTWFSANVERVTGVPPEWHYGKTREELGAPDVPPEVWAEHLETLRQRKPFKDFIFHRRGPDGDKWLKAAGLPVFDAAGAFRGYRGTGADVTAEMEFQIAAEKASTLLESVVESLEQVFSVWGPDDRLVVCNEKFRQINAAIPAVTKPGVLFEDHIRASLEAGLIREAAGREEEWLAARMKQHREPGAPFEMARHDRAWLLLSEQRLPDGTTVTIGIDITDRKNAELTIAESEALLNSVIENVPVGLLLKDANLRIERANETYLKWYGFTQEEISGKPSDEFSVIDSENEFEVMLQQERDALRTGRTQTRFADRVLSDGKVHTLSITKFPIFDAEGKVIKVGSASVDLTEEMEARAGLIRSEARFRDFAESASDWLWEMDENLRLTFVSERYRALTGFDPEFYIGKTRYDVSLEDTDGEKWRLHKDDLDNRRPFRDFQYDVRRSDGSPLSVSINGKPVFDSGGAFRGYRGTGKDVTAQVNADAARDKALDEAQAANRAKSDFLANMSHDLRTPLNAILGFSDILREQIFGPIGSQRYCEYAGDIHSSASFLLSMVNDLLDISKIEAGKRVLDRRPFSLNELVRECINTLMTQAYTKDIRIADELPDHLPSLFADRQACQQVLLNLLTNAIKFTSVGGWVRISARSSIDELTIVIEDTGSGMPSDQIEELTRPFTQGGSEPYKTNEGSGLGLSIAESLVNLHGGRMHIDSELGAGTTVTITLPNGEIASYSARQGES